MQAREEPKTKPFERYANTGTSKNQEHLTESANRRAPLRCKDGKRRPLLVKSHSTLASILRS